MVITALLTFVYYLLLGLLQILPQGGSIPASWTSGVVTVWGYVNAFSLVVPIAELLIALGIILAWDIFAFAWHFIPWLLKKLPFLNIK